MKRIAEQQETCAQREQHKRHAAAWERPSFGPPLHREDRDTVKIILALYMHLLQLLWSSCEESRNYEMNTGSSRITRNERRIYNWIWDSIRLTNLLWYNNGCNHSGALRKPFM